MLSYSTYLEPEANAEIYYNSDGQCSDGSVSAIKNGERLQSRDSHFSMGKISWKCRFLLEISVHVSISFDSTLRFCNIGDILKKNQTCDCTFAGQKRYMYQRCCHFFGTSVLTYLPTEPHKCHGIWPPGLSLTQPNPTPNPVHYSVICIMDVGAIVTISTWRILEMSHIITFF